MLLYLWRAFLKVHCNGEQSLFCYSEKSLPFVMIVFMDGFLVIISVSCFTSYVFCPRSERWLWYLAHLVDCREEMQASQNKLHNKLLAGGKKLCTHNLLMVCKLRAEFAPSSILHLSPPFFSSIPSSPHQRLSPFLPLFFQKVLQGK